MDSNITQMSINLKFDPQTYSDPVKLDEFYYDTFMNCLDLISNKKLLYVIEDDLKNMVQVDTCFLLFKGKQAGSFQKVIKQLGFKYTYQLEEQERKIKILERFKYLTGFKSTKDSIYVRVVKAKKGMKCLNSFKQYFFVHFYNCETQKVFRSTKKNEFEYTKQIEMTKQVISDSEEEEENSQLSSSLQKKIKVEEKVTQEIAQQAKQRDQLCQAYELIKVLQKEVSQLTKDNMDIKRKLSSLEFYIYYSSNYEREVRIQKDLSKDNQFYQEMDILKLFDKKGNKAIEYFNQISDEETQENE